MSVSIPFLRGGRPATVNLNDLIERLESAPGGDSARYDEWAWTSFFPRQWCHEARHNATSSPVFHTLLGRQTVPCGGTGDSEPSSACEWHLLLTFCQADGYEALAPYTVSGTTIDLTSVDSAAASASSRAASATTTTLTGASTLLEAVDRLVQALPSRFLPSRCTFVAVLEGDTHVKLGLFSESRWINCIDAVRKRCHQRLGTSSGSTQACEFSHAHLMRDWSAVVPLCGADKAEAPLSLAVASPSFAETLRTVLAWLCTPDSSTAPHTLPFTKDTSVPILGDEVDATDDHTTAAEWHNAYNALLDTTLALHPLLWTGCFREVDEAREKATVSSVETLTGLAKLRAQRDAARAEWRQRVGHSVVFSVPEAALGATATTHVDPSAAPATKPASDALFRHVLLLQKPPRAPTKEGNEASHGGPAGGRGPSSAVSDPIVTAAAMEGISLDADAVRPLPIAAQLHLYPDRGDADYVESVGLRNTQGAMLDVHLDDYTHEDGEVFVQLGPVEGVPFAALDAFIHRCEAASKSTATATDAATTHATTGELLRAALANGPDGAHQPDAPHWLPPQCEGSRSRFMYPRVLFRRPTGALSKQNPLAKSHASVSVAPPTAPMLRAAAGALSYLSEHVHAPATPETMTKASGTVVLPISSYTLSTSITATTEQTEDDGDTGSSERPAREHKCCAWCGRTRQRLLRCSGCRAVHYCCASHQALDWKTGSHRSECNLFLHAQRIQEQVLGPLVQAATAVAPQTEPRVAPPLSVGGSFAVSTMAFVSTVEVSRAANHHSHPLSAFPLCVHVVGVPAACVDDFLATLGALAAGSRHTSSCPVRLLLSVPDLPGDRRNQVWASTSRDSAVLRLVPETGVLGDVWRQHHALTRVTASDEAPTTSPAARDEEDAVRVRLVNAAYHTWRETAGPEAVQRDNTLGSSSSPLPLSYSAADGVLVFGPLNGCGLSYLTASLDTVAEHELYRRPVRCVDSAFVGAVRTAQALAARAVNNERLAPEVRRRVERARHTVPVFPAAASPAPLPEAGKAPSKEKTVELMWPVHVNRDGFGPAATHLMAPDTAENDATSLLAAGSHSNRVPLSLVVTNAFYFDVPAEL